MMKIGAAATMLAVAIAVLVALVSGSRTRAMETHCRNNLRHLGGLAGRNWNTIDPRRTGRDFWQAVREAQYRDVRGNWQPIDPDPFVCPVLGTTVSRIDDARTIDYRGPIKVREQLKDTPRAEPIGADRAGNHRSGGYVLRVDTSIEALPPVIVSAKEGDPLWRSAEGALKD
jgi:hypothetical protein